jgi:hypothetical protein
MQSGDHTSPLSAAGVYPIPGIIGEATGADDQRMDTDRTSDLLAYADRLGEPYEGLASRTPEGAVHAHVDEHPMSDEQAVHLAHLMRRIGRVPEVAMLTFGQAKARIAELLDELASGR